MTSASICPRMGCACPRDFRDCVASGLLDGDFAAFHDRHRVTFLKYLELRGLSRHDAEDVVSDAFVTLYVRRSVLRAAEVPEAFAFHVLRDALVDFWRRRSRRPETLVESVEEQRAPDEVSGLVALLDFQRLLAGLSARQAECLALYALLGRDAAEIARYLEIDVSTVHSHISYARERLAGLFDAPDEAEETR